MLQRLSHFNELFERERKTERDREKQTERGEREKENKHWVVEKVSVLSILCMLKCTLNLKRDFYGCRSPCTCIYIIKKRYPPLYHYSVSK